MLDKLDLKCELPGTLDGSPEEVATRLSMEGLVATFGFAMDARWGFAGVFVGERDTGKANAADTFLLCGKCFEVGTGTIGFLMGEASVGIWLDVAEDAFAVSSISVAKVSGGMSDGGLDVEGNRSLLPAGNLNWPGGRAGVRARCCNGRVVNFFIGEIFGV